VLHKINLNNHGKRKTKKNKTKNFHGVLFRSQISELKKQNHELLERVHHLQNEVTDSDMRRHELENQLRNANLVSF
jgi:hypothetical protein